MIKTNNHINRINWIDTLKFLAAIFVFWGHLYYCIYYYRLDKAEFGGFVIFAIERIFYFTVYAGWWVYVFCIISGLLAGNQKINTFRKFVTLVLNRYIRFIVPVFVANFIVWIVTLHFNSPVVEFGNRFNNEWILSFKIVDKAFIDVVKSTILLSEDFIAPLWMLKYIYIGTCFVYFLIFLRYKFARNIFYIIIGEIMICVLLLFVAVPKCREFLIYSLLPNGGVLIKKVWKTDILSKAMSNNANVVTLLSSVGILAVLCFLNIHPHWIFAVITALLFVFLIPYSKPVVKFLENNFLRKVNYLSFTIYLIHFPVICYSSLSFFEKFYSESKYLLVSLLTYFVTTTIVLGGSYLYYIVIEKRIDALISRVSKKISYILITKYIEKSNLERNQNNA